MTRKRYDSLADLSPFQLEVYEELRSFVAPLAALTEEYNLAKRQLDELKKDSSLFHRVTLKSPLLTHILVSGKEKELSERVQGLKLRLKYAFKIRSFHLRQCYEAKVPHKFITPLLGIAPNKLSQYLYHNTDWYRIIKKDLGKSYGQKKDH